MGTSKNRFEKRKYVRHVEDEKRLRKHADARRGDLTKYSAWLARFLSNGFLEVPLYVKCNVSAAVTNVQCFTTFS
jgi:hypothetical protein